MTNTSPTSDNVQAGPASSISSQILLTRTDLAALGIKFSNSQLLRLEAVKRFPRRLRLSAASVCWDREEVLAWIEARRAERARWHYADIT